MSQAKRQRRQSIRGSQAAAKKRRRTAPGPPRPGGPAMGRGEGEIDARLGFLASGASDALRRAARASTPERTEEDEDEDEDIGDFETELSLVAEYLADLDELLVAPLDPGVKTGDGTLLLAAYRRERERLGGRRFSEGETGLDPFDALDQAGRIELLTLDRDRTIEVVGLMVARGTDWDPFGAMEAGRPN